MEESKYFQQTLLSLSPCSFAFYKQLACRILLAQQATAYLFYKLRMFGSLFTYCNVAIFPYLHSMKYLLIIVFVALFTYKASAQKLVPVHKITEYIGKVISVHDTISNSRIVNKHLTYYMGGKHPKPKLIVIHHGTSVDQGNLSITVTGKVIVFHGKPAIVARRPEQLALHIY
ncbi:hypothetical protein KHS38_15245 [Mucilaginibacter sp. Bleaf8]|uniref:hypothetical protein n=1 Tax=Mucilaginibacter sp. Bleaf8 TaxID=2834430 RepID=UPI001BCDE673|nr:hypothetical protein [Mucilaginibacter sp. Bleaf8]MBS7565763.1 hypothetical protein [Mucilaginibacter sp. Bleaf8]